MPTPWHGENTISTGGFLLYHSVSFMYCICIKIRSIHLLIELLRSPRNFDSILGLYRPGKLHLSQGVSGGNHPSVPPVKRQIMFTAIRRLLFINVINLPIVRFSVYACHLVAVLLNSIALYLYTHFKFRTTVINDLITNHASFG